MDLALTLAVRAGPDAGRTLRFTGPGPWVYGRAGTPDVDLALPRDPRVGRRHLVLRPEGRGVHVQVAEAKYQVWVDGRAVAAAVVGDGASLALGDTRLTLHLEGALHGPGDGGADRRGTDGGARAVPAVPRRRLEEFELGAELGAGGLGRVLAARDRRTGAEVAVKLLLPDLLEDEEAVAQFVRETDMLCRVQHPSIVRALAVGREPQGLFLAMERLPGRNVDQVVAAEGPLPLAEALAVTGEVLRALAHAHAVGVVHRDVKPHNVMLERSVMLQRGEGGPPRVWLLDFGLAKPLREGSAAGLTATGHFKGTLPFAAPECLVDAKRVTPAADLFSTAATLYWALTGAHWFRDSDNLLQLTASILEGALVPLCERRPELPSEVAAFVEQGLATAPAQRWPSAEAAYERLRALGAAHTL